MESKLVEIVKYFKDNGVNIEIKLTADEIPSAEFVNAGNTIGQAIKVIDTNPVRIEVPANVETCLSEPKVPVFTEPPMKTASKPPKEVKEKKAPQKSIFEEASKEEISEEQIMRTSSEASVVIGREKVKELIAEFASTGKLLDIKKEDRASYTKKLNKLVEEHNEKSAF